MLCYRLLGGGLDMDNIAISFKFWKHFSVVTPIVAFTTVLL
jgi:hypothetical protein